MLNYANLRDIQRRELESSALVKLQDNFYTEVADFLKTKKQEALKDNSMLSLREFENIKRIVRAIQVKREEKIVLMAIRGESTAMGLTSEESEMLKGLFSIIMKSRSHLAGVYGEVPKVSSEKQVRLLQEVEEYKGLDNNTYGPFKKGEERTLPSDEAKWLVQAGMAELV